MFLEQMFDLSRTCLLLGKIKIMIPHRIKKKIIGFRWFDKKLFGATLM